MISPATLQQMAQACRDHLGPVELAIVHRASSERTERFVDYLMLYSGQDLTPEEFARLALDCAQRALTPGGAS